MADHTSPLQAARELRDGARQRFDADISVLKQRFSKPDATDAPQGAVTNVAAKLRAFTKSHAVALGAGAALAVTAGLAFWQRARLQALALSLAARFYAAPDEAEISHTEDPV